MVRRYSRLRLVWLESRPRRRSGRVIVIAECAASSRCNSADNVDPRFEYAGLPACNPVLLRISGPSANPGSACDLTVDDIVRSVTIRVRVFALFGAGRCRPSPFRAAWGVLGAGGRRRSRQRRVRGCRAHARRATARTVIVGAGN